MQRETDQMPAVEFATNSVPGNSVLRVRLGQKCESVDAARPLVWNLNGWRVSFHFERLLVVFRHTVVKSVAQVVQLVKRVLHALIVRGEDVTFGINGDSGRVAEGVSERSRGSVRRNLQHFPSPA